MDDPEISYTYDKGKIESISDVLDIVSRPYHYFPELLDDDQPPSKVPIGWNSQGHPRPYPHGIWFRGVDNTRFEPIPSVFRNKINDNDLLYYDERDMFVDLRLRSSDADLRGYDNIELMGIMQHHKLPTRLMDWTESPLIACHFASFSQYFDYRDKKTDYHDMSVKDDPAIYVLNAYRLNSLTNLSLNEKSGILQQSDFDVYFRSIMAEHTHLNSILRRDLPVNKVTFNTDTENIYEIFGNIRKFIEYGDTVRLREEINSEEKLNNLLAFMNRMRSPVALIPRRNHPRMDVQLSCFTIHGGKLSYHTPNPISKSRRDPPVSMRNFIQEPLHLHHINNDGAGFKSLSPINNFDSYRFMKKFKISRHAVNRIMIELDRLGITESMIFPDLENQAAFAKRRWRTIDGERSIFSMPAIDRKALGDYNRNQSGETWSRKMEKNYMKLLYDESYKIRSNRKSKD